jgi:hypothetical protein
VSGASSRGWAAFCLLGIALWIGATILVAVVNDDPSDGRPVLLAFATGAALFFGTMFGAAWWQTRARADPELDALLGELALSPGAGGGRAPAVGAMRAVARAYLLLGALVTALGLAAIVQEGLEVGNPRSTLYVMVGIVVTWAAAVPFVVRRANSASSAVLAPLGLTQNGTTLSGERHGPEVTISLTATGSTTRVESASGPITIRRDGHGGPGWLRDLRLAERLAEPPNVA